MRVAIIDFSHFEVVEAFTRVLKPICTELHLVVSQWISDDLLSIPDLCDEAIRIHVRSAENQVEGLRELLTDENIDLSIFSTIDDQYERYERLLSSLNIRRLLVVHNVNFWFAKKKVFRVFRKPRSPLHETLLSCVSHVEGLVVLSPGLKRFIQESYAPRQPVVEFTTCIARAERDEGDEGADRLHCVVPGQVERHRRDYALILHTISLLNKDDVELTLLGAPMGDYGFSIIQDCERLVANGYRIKWFDSYVPQDEFDREMCRASVVLSPILPATSFAGMPEQYGVSKITGAIPDMVRYGKPGVLPVHVAIPAELKTSVLTYATRSELGSILRRLTGRDARHALHQNARTNAKYWEVEKVRARFVAELQRAGIGGFVRQAS